MVLGAASKMRPARATRCRACSATRPASPSRRLHLGYREARLLAELPIGRGGTAVRGHEFHYASIADPGGDEKLAVLADAAGRALGEAGGRRGRVSGTFFHAIAPVP